MSDRDWRELYGAAVNEVDPGLLMMRIEAGEAAILLRLEILEKQSGSVDERLAIYDALSNLRALKIEARHWPAPEQGSKPAP